MKRNLILAGMACLTFAACKPARSASREREIVAAPAPALVENADADAPVPEPVEAFAFAQDGGGKILAKILPPREAAPIPPEPKAGPKPRRGLATLEHPELPFAMPSPAIPAIQLGKKPPLRPRSLPDSAPLAYLQNDSNLPQRPELPASALVRQSARDVNEPAALPSQAKPLADRAALDDPTADFSGQQVIAFQPATREAMVPFSPINLPDPFENRAVARPLNAEAPIVAPVPALPK